MHALSIDIMGFDISKLFVSLISAFSSKATSKNSTTWEGTVWFWHLIYKANSTSDSI